MVYPRERFLAALQGEKPDRTPLAHVAAMTTVELQQATGCSMPDVHHRPESQVRLLAANHETLGFDAVTFIINFFNEPAALGAEMDWGHPTQLPRVVSHPWTDVPDATLPDDLLDRPPVSTYLDTLRIAKRELGSKVAVLGKVMGPFSMVQMMHGVENVLLGLFDAPDKIRVFLDVATECLVTCAHAQLEIGIDALAIGEGGAGAQMLSPAMYESMLLPVHQRLLRRIEGPTIMHVCGDVTPRLRHMRQTGMTCFNFDWAIAPAAMVAQAAGAFSLMGNVNTTDLLSGAEAEIERQVFDNLEAGVDIISPGCAISPSCPNRNLLAMASAIDHYFSG
jgi:[methyl-Co(III) methanol-specific corrinoid protein]:coenzyme M methyltransferase